LSSWKRSLRLFATSSPGLLCIHVDDDPPGASLQILVIVPEVKIAEELLMLGDE
jgi:hypothetical protein